MGRMFRKTRDERGAATVEFFFAIPFVIALGMAGLEFVHMAAMQTSVDDAAHAAARTMAQSASATEADARAAALAAAGSLPGDSTSVSVSTGETASSGYTHHLPAATGSAWVDRPSTTKQPVTATVESSYSPTTPVGTAISDALGTPGTIGFKSTATEWRDSTVEGGASSW